MTIDEMNDLALGKRYTDIQEKSDAGIVAIYEFLWSFAILSGVSRDGYEDRWCYPTYEAARTALDRWDGADNTEPEGWHRHPNTGRRVDEDGIKIVYR